MDAPTPSAEPPNAILRGGSQVRRWALENGHDVHAHGLMPWTVLRAYEAAGQ